MFKKIFLGADHAGKNLLQEITEFLKTINFEFEILETKETEDYTDIAKKVCKRVEESIQFCGILICGSGVGVSIVANRFKNIRAALSHLPEIAKLSRNHNNANVLCLGARMLTTEKQLEIVSTFLKSDFEGERHELRINKINIL